MRACLLCITREQVWLIVSWVVGSQERVIGNRLTPGEQLHRQCHKTVLL
jgi:hypothetical protein